MSMAGPLRPCLQLPAQISRKMRDLETTMALLDVWK